MINGELDDYYAGNHPLIIVYIVINGESTNDSHNGQ
jgi:hypothetical protein